MPCVMSSTYKQHGNSISITVTCLHKTYLVEGTIHNIILLLGCALIIVVKVTGNTNSWNR